MKLTLTHKSGYGESQTIDIGRNEPCFCKSGRKFKNCCLVQMEKEKDKEKEESQNYLNARLLVKARARRKEREEHGTNKANCNG